MTLEGLLTLKTLNLSHNNLSGLIPVKLSGLRQLARLELSYNNLRFLEPSPSTPFLGFFFESNSVSW